MTPLELLIAFNAFIWICCTVVTCVTNDTDVLIIPSAFTIVSALVWFLYYIISTMPPHAR